LSTPLLVGAAALAVAALAGHAPPPHCAPPPPPQTHTHQKGDIWAATPTALSSSATAAL